MKKQFLLGMMIVFLVGLVSASSLVGVGVTPSKMELNLVGGETKDIELLVFNTGDGPNEVVLSAEGDIASFVTFEPATAILDPEPMPHTLPIKNGKIFHIKFKAPAEKESKNYVGLISASTLPAKEQGFSGSVGSAVQVKLTVNPPLYLKQIIGVLTLHDIVLGAAFIPLILSGFLIVRKIKKKRAKKR